MQAPETELKFPVTNIEVFRSTVGSLGLQLRTERSFETNTLYDTPGRDLRAQRQLLRVRQYGSTCVVTHKRVPPGNPESARFKTRIETESVVEDGAALAEIFCQLGYCPAFRYEKFRTEWDAPEGGHLVLDETPIGIWAELEGEPQWIESMLDMLGVPVSSTLTESYGMLFLQWKEDSGSQAENLTFDEIPSEQTQIVGVR